MSSGAIVLLSAALFAATVVCQNFPEQGPTPPPDPYPTISEGIYWHLYYIPAQCQDPVVITYPYGGIVDKKAALVRRDNPHLIYGNIEIAPGACLFIEPGTVLQFGPGYGMKVNGTLISRGSEEEGGRIVFTKDPNAAAKVGPISDWPDNARLVAGNTTRDGKLELMHQNKWRGICTNYVNFTAIDADVTCRQLGFLKGNFTYHSFAKNQSDYMLFTRPQCTGNENSLFDCPGRQNIRVGSNICDGQQVVGFECEGLRSDLALDHWRGIEMYNSTLELNIDDNFASNESLSHIEYTDFLYAGLDVYRSQSHNVRYPFATISASPYPPIMNNVTIQYGAYDALNFTDIRGTIHVANSTISHNRGHGMFLMTAVGRVIVNTTNITNNWGDGIKLYVSNYTIPNWENHFPTGESFCSRSILRYPSYPILIHQDVIDVFGNRPGVPYCNQQFFTTEKKKITLHFLLLERDKSATGFFEISDKFGRKYGPVDITNGSYPQSITIDNNEMQVKFHYDIPRSGCKTFKPCMRFLILLDSYKVAAPDFQLIHSTVSNNTGHGVSIQDMRSNVFFNTTEISHNQFEAGLRIYQGAGEVIVNNTLLENNSGSGINVTYSGGYQLFNNTRLHENKGYGIITEYINVNRTRIERRMLVEVVRCGFQLNEGIALRLGNYCLGGLMLVNLSHFSHNMDEAIEYLSCNITAQESMNFTAAFNTFDGNRRHGILASPLLNTVGIMTNNTFVNHSLGCVRVENGYDLIINRWYSRFRVNYEIFQNEFFMNNGRYAISLRLTQNSVFQKLHCKFNRFTNNYIQESFATINPRSRANAVAIISSSNVLFQRNSIDNPDSVRSVSTHLVDPSVTIDATLNWWGNPNHAFIYDQIFDQDDRYNLAYVEYFPALLVDLVYEDVPTLPPRHHWQFHRGSTIGGTLERRIRLPRGVYTVDKDIFIKPSYRLEIASGSILQFETSIGIVVHGCLTADGGSEGNAIVFSLQESSVQIDNETLTVRLLDGEDEYEGRLEVQINGVWGTICDEDWTEQNSAIACQQLGMTYNPHYSQMKLVRSAPGDTPVVLTRVRCDDLDTDVSTCRSVREDIQCGHNQDVFVRCQPPTWAGITLPATPKGRNDPETQLRYLTIDKAGLLDYATMSYTPALRIDYNYHSVSHLTVENSVSDGVNIKYTYPYSENRFEYCRLNNNLGNGFLVRNPNVQLKYSTMKNNGKAGFVYDPFFTEYRALSVRNSIDRGYTTSMTAQLTSQSLDSNTMIFLISDPGLEHETKTYQFEVYVSNPTTSRITLQILDYNPLTSIERVVVYDARVNSISGNTKIWRIEEDLVDFPIVSTAAGLTISIQVTGVLSGRLTFAAISRNVAMVGPPAVIYVYNSTIQHNNQGISTKHYNNPSNNRQELYIRHKSEQIHFELVNVHDNVNEAMHIPSVTKYHENYVPSFDEITTSQRVGVITYTIEHSNFYRNGKGILAEHNHVDFANNIWKWKLDFCKIKDNLDGGLEVELPRVMDEVDGQTHSLVLKNSLMEANKNFAFTIAGHYAEVNVSSNDFRNNECRKGLMTVSGMEKDILVYSNSFTGNVGRYIIDFDIISHAELSVSVKGTISFNDIRNNRNSDQSSQTTTKPVTYTVALRGLQDVVATRNLFTNPFDYELIAGITALSLENTVDVRENWWGFTDQFQIKRRIFDFDDWNNYAIADYFPYLVQADLRSEVASGSQIDIPLDLNNLGGRIMTPLVLPARSEPYRVVADLTVMPQATLTIEPGTELQFEANVGILVLGRLVARGLPYNRIKLTPAPVQANANDQRLKRSSPNLRLIGGLKHAEGFLEMFNTSTKSWNIMCDHQFNEKTAEVVCRQLGFETVNVRVRFTHLYDYYVYGEQLYFRKEFWGRSYYCRGDEDDLNQCMSRDNYHIMQCIRNENYTFIRCGDRNIPSIYRYWGNIRFSPPTYEEVIQGSSENTLVSHLENIDIYGGGILHDEKVGAIQATYITPYLKNINVTNCASNAYDFVAPRNDLVLSDLNVTGNLGYGMNILVLNGDSRDGPYSSFEPLVKSTIPYYLYGLVEICRMEKEITVTDRLLLYYKYTQNSVDCVKIIRSKSPFKKVALRFLQFNLYTDDFAQNVVEIFDGSQVDPSKMIGEVTSNSSHTDVLRLYQTADGSSVMMVHIHASVSFGSYGFIAEVVTLPLSGLTYPDSKYQHLISNTILKDNQDGGLMYQNVGEINPSVKIHRCWIENNGVSILNLTSIAAIDISIQDTISFDFSNNFVSKNKGAMLFDARTRTIATALTGNITNNVFAYTGNGEALNMSGHHFQRVYVFNNYFFNNTAGDYRDVIHVQDVVVNFTYNTLISNKGFHILSAYNAENINTAASQLYTRNGFQHNNATALFRATVFVGSGKPRFHYNYLVNQINDFELQTNRKVVNGLRMDEEPVNMSSNWWGSPLPAFIQGRMWDGADDKDLVSAIFRPYEITNISVVEGNCPPGWKLHEDKCYRYMGAVLPYQAAMAFCRENQGFLADYRGKGDFLHYLMRLMENEYDYTLRAWVYSDSAAGQCGAIEYKYLVYEQDCEHVLHPFICEKDPDIVPPGFGLLAVIIGSVAGVLGLLLIIIIIILILWLVKSKRRKNERFFRRESIRNSSIHSRSVISMLSEYGSKRRLPGSQEGMASVHLGGVTVDATSTDTIHKSQSDISSMNGTTPGSTIERNLLRTRPNLSRSRDTAKHENKAYKSTDVSTDSEFDDSKEHLRENGANNVNHHVQSRSRENVMNSQNSVFDNRSFDDHSIDAGERSRSVSSFESPVRKPSGTPDSLKERRAQRPRIDPDSLPTPPPPPPGERTSSLSSSGAPPITRYHRSQENVASDSPSSSSYQSEEKGNLYQSRESIPSPVAMPIQPPAYSFKLPADHRSSENINNQTLSPYANVPRDPMLQGQADSVPYQTGQQVSRSRENIFNQPESFGNYQNVARPEYNIDGHATQPTTRYDDTDSQPDYRYANIPGFRATPPLAPERSHSYPSMVDDVTSNRPQLPPSYPPSPGPNSRQIESGETMQCPPPPSYNTGQGQDYHSQEHLQDPKPNYNTGQGRDYHSQEHLQDPKPNYNTGQGRDYHSQEHLQDPEYRHESRDNIDVIDYRVGANYRLQKPQPLETAM